MVIGSVILMGFFMLLFVGNANYGINANTHKGLKTVRVIINYDKIYWW